MTAYLKESLDRGVINRNEFRIALRYESVEDDNMDVFTVASDVITLDQAIHDMPLLNPKSPI
jgi:hypothetical protein